MSIYLNIWRVKIKLLQINDEQMIVASDNTVIYAGYLHINIVFSKVLNNICLPNVMMYPGKYYYMNA